MGSRGAGAARNTGTSKSPQDKFVGKRVSEFKDIRASQVEEMLGLSKLTQSQKNTIAEMLRSMASNDYSYDGNRTPYRIDQFSLTKIGEEFSASGTGDISVLITTGGDTGRSYIDFLDRNTRLFIIGKKGGAYTYNDRKKVSVKSFTVRYGKRD